MRVLAASFLLLLLIGSSAFGQGYDLKVHLRSGETVTIPGSEIRRITFAESSLGVDPSPVNTARMIQYLRSYPNPFRPSTTIEFVTAAEANVRVRVYDARGSLVRELVNDDLVAGRHQLPWDGTDRNHARVPNGLYFYQVTCGAQTLAGRLILLK